MDIDDQIDLDFRNSDSNIVIQGIKKMKLKNFYLMKKDTHDLLRPKAINSDYLLEKLYLNTP